MMNTKTVLILKSVMLIVLGSGIACQTHSTENVNISVSQANKATAENKTSTNNNGVQFDANKTDNSNKTGNKSSTTSGSQATPTEAYKYAYAARKNKDIEGLKRVLSKDAQEFLQMMSQPDDSIDKTLLQMTETPQAATDESRAEKINGNRATLEYPDADGKWKTMDLIKEDGVWKITFGNGDKPKVETSKNR